MINEIESGLVRNRIHFFESLSINEFTLTGLNECQNKEPVSESQICSNKTFIESCVSVNIHQHTSITLFNLFVVYYFREVVNYYLMSNPSTPDKKISNVGRIT